MNMQMSVWPANLVWFKALNQENPAERRVDRLEDRWKLCFNTIQPSFLNAGLVICKLLANGSQMKFSIKQIWAVFLFFCPCEELLMEKWVEGLRWSTTTLLAPVVFCGWSVSVTRERSRVPTLNFLHEEVMRMCADIRLQPLVVTINSVVIDETDECFQCFSHSHWKMCMSTHEHLKPWTGKLQPVKSVFTSC